MYAILNTKEVKFKNNKLKLMEERDEKNSNCTFFFSQYTVICGE